MLKTISPRQLSYVIVIKIFNDYISRVAVMIIRLCVKVIPILLFAGFLALLSGCGQSRQYHDESRMLMDTIISIRAYPADSSPAVARAFDVFAAVEEMASFHRDSSELSALNRSFPLQLSASFTGLIDQAFKFYALTEGFFDPSFAAVQKAWGFYDGVGRIPPEAELEQILAEKTGLEKILTRHADGSLALASGSLIDFGGLAGGHAIELAAAVLRESGCTAFLIDDAGDIWFEGTKPDGSLWRVAVRDPRDNGVLAMIESPTSLAISTSGDYERFVTIDGKNYGHIMNPHTGRPVEYYSSVTVVADSPVAADALSTALFAMPPEKSAEFCKQHGVAALFLDKNGHITITETGRPFFKQVKAP